jgi:TM2 domain-containing membrane protein YozV
MVAREPYSQCVTTDPMEPQDGQTRPEYPQADSFEPPYVAPTSGSSAGYTAYTAPYAQPTYQAGYAPQPGFAPAGMPYAQSYGVDAYGRPLSDKSKVVAGILGLLLGGFGAGRFYIGDNKTAVLQLIVTLVTCGVGHLWGMIDGILILVNGGTDAQGRILRD